MKPPPLHTNCLHTCPTTECSIPAASGECLACDEAVNQMMVIARVFPQSMRSYWDGYGIIPDERQWQLDHPSLQMSALPDEAIRQLRPLVVLDGGRDVEATYTDDLLPFLWRSHVVQSLGASERQTAAWLAGPYGAQGQLAAALGVSQATVSRDQSKVRRLLRLNFDDDFLVEFEPMVGRRALSRPTLVA